MQNFDENNILHWAGTGEKLQLTALYIALSLGRGLGQMTDKETEHCTQKLKSGCYNKKKSNGEFY